MTSKPLSTSTIKPHSKRPQWISDHHQDLFKLPPDHPDPPPTPTHVKQSTTHIIVNPRQRGNPILEWLQTVPYTFGDTSADYVLGRHAAALFISIKYHRLHPEYLTQRFRDMAKQFTLRVLLVHVDVGDYKSTVLELSQLCITHEFTLILAWNDNECARYLEMYKLQEASPPDILLGKQETDDMSRLITFLTQIPGVNRTDVLTLVTRFDSLVNIVRAPLTALERCPGIGEKKARRIYETFRAPFKIQPGAIPVEEDL